MLASLFSGESGTDRILFQSFSYYMMIGIHCWLDLKWVLHARVSATPKVLKGRKETEKVVIKTRLSGKTWNLCATNSTALKNSWEGQAGKPGYMCEYFVWRCYKNALGWSQLAVLCCTYFFASESSRSCFWNRHHCRMCLQGAPSGKQTV